MTDTETTASERDLAAENAELRERIDRLRTMHRYESDRFSVFVNLADLLCGNSRVMNIINSDEYQNFLGSAEWFEPEVVLSDLGLMDEDPTPGPTPTRTGTRSTQG